MKDVATEFEENHLTDINIVKGNDPVIQVGTNFLKDADLKPYLVNKNVITDNKSVNKDYDSAPVAAYSSFHITKRSLPDGSVPQETHFMAVNSYLLPEVIIIIPKDEKSSSNMEIISTVEGNSQLKFNAANLKATDTEFQASGSRSATHESIVEIEKMLPKFEGIPIVPQANKEAEIDTFFKTDIPQSHIETIIPKDIHEAPTNNKTDMRVVTDPAVNTIFPGNKEIVTSQANTLQLQFPYSSTQHSNHWKGREKSECCYNQISKCNASSQFLHCF